MFNIGNTGEVTIRELAERVKALTGSQSPIQLVPYDEAYEAGFEDMPRRVPDITKIHDLIGYEPQAGARRDHRGGSIELHASDVEWRVAGSDRSGRILSSVVLQGTSMLRSAASSLARRSVCSRCRRAAAQQPVKLQIPDGQVTLNAQNAPLRAILAEWARLGGTNDRQRRPRIGGPPSRSSCTDVPERQALDIAAARRQRLHAGAAAGGRAGVRRSSTAS